jgi:hypothetical protein
LDTSINGTSLLAGGIKKIPAVEEIRKIFNRVRTSWEGTRMGRAINSFWAQ